MHPIYLVGAGPGIPALLTVRAAQLLGSADLVLHDPGAGEELLALAPAALLQSAGALDAGAVAAAALAAAAGGARVVRLLEGDPLTSVRGAAEARALGDRGATLEIVPGLAPETAALAYAGIALPPAAPLALVRLGNGAGERALLSVAAAADAGAAAATLLRAGLAPDTPAAIVARAAAPAQAVRLSTLAALSLQPGEDAGGTLVAAAGDALARRNPWFERRPLFGRRIVVTRPRAQGADLVAWLSAQGAEAVLFPAIRIVPPPDPEPLARAAAGVRGYDWVIFTSVNGVERFWWALEAAGLDTRSLGGARVAAIGPATAEALTVRGVRPDLVPPRYVAESVLESLAATELRAARVLLPRAAGARDLLPARLTQLGARVTEVEAYRSVPDVAGAAGLRRRLERGEIDAVTFTSSSTVSSFVEAVGVDVGRAIVACIGPVTAATATRLGLSVTLVAEEHSVPGLQSVLSRHFASF